MCAQRVHLWHTFYIPSIYGQIYHDIWVICFTKLFGLIPKLSYFGLILDQCEQSQKICQNFLNLAQLNYINPSPRTFIEACAGPILGVYQTCSETFFPVEIILEIFSIGSSSFFLIITISHSPPSLCAFEIISCNCSFFLHLLFV